MILYFSFFQKHRSIMQYCIVSILCVVGFVCSQNPGLKIGLTQTGLEYAASVAIEIISQDLVGKSLPDQSGSQDVTVGNVEYHAYNLKLTEFNRPDSYVVVNPGSGISWQLLRARISLTGALHYEYKWGFIKISDTVDFDISINGVGISASISLGKNNEGEPTISLAGCSGQVDDVNVHFHGGAAWLYNIFSGSLENPIRDALRHLICDSARKAVENNAAKALATLKLQFELDDVLLFDCKLSQPPSFQLSYVESYHKGEMFWKGDASEVPFQAAPFPPSANQQMMNFFISAYVVNSLGYVLHKRNILQYKLSKNDLPPEDQDLLNTTCSGLGKFCIGTFIPQLGLSYPGSSVIVSSQTLTPPTINIDPNTLEGYFYGNMTYRAITPAGNDVFLFKTLANVTFELTSFLDGNMVKAKISHFRAIINVTDSAVGVIKSESLSSVFTTLAKAFFVKKLNVIGEKGFALPSIDHIAYLNPNLRLVKDAVEFSTDVKYI